VAVKPYLIYSDSYEYRAPGTPKEPTAAQVPTTIRGAVDMTVFNAGASTIKVSGSTPKQTYYPSESCSAEWT
jgi:hypothetical protein